ncbi:MAG: quinolinate synthase NadA [Bacteroidia bacterium]|nr:quinolinate synthase NadA [Bacteroidia bacterium]MBP9688066.1 quinolinate synthase NadA [Bacteroidia bacterium]
MTLASQKFNYATAIKRLKQQKNAVILAHYYQEEAIQDIADFVGDSLGLSKQAAQTKADIIVFAGVHFMAETAKILNPNKKVLLPDLEAGCSLASSCTPQEFSDFKQQYPNHIVVSYINCSAEIKTQSDIICTSSNAKKIIESIPSYEKIIFAPDRNLGKYLIKETGRDMVLWDGACIVHEAFSFNKLVDLYKKHPKAKLVVHPESEADLLTLAHFVGSTAAMINYVKQSDASEFIIATEAGILHQMSQEAPNKILIPAPSKEDNTCACSECAFMKLNTLEKLYNCLLNETPEITLSNDVIECALIPLNRMLALS